MRQFPSLSRVQYFSMSTMLEGFRPRLCGACACSGACVRAIFQRSRSLSRTAYLGLLDVWDTLRLTRGMPAISRKAVDGDTPSASATCAGRSNLSAMAVSPFCSLSVLFLFSFVQWYHDGSKGVLWVLDLPIEYQDALLWFLDTGEVCANTISNYLSESTAKYLVKLKLVKYDRYDPNLRYLLPDSQRDSYFYSITKEGEKEALLIRNQRSKEGEVQAQVVSFRHQLLQVQQQSADALERMRKDFAEYQREQNRQNQQNSLDHAKMEKKNRRSTWLQIIFTAVFSPLAALCVEHFQDIVTFFQSLFHG